MARISAKGVIVGSIVDLALSLGSGIAFGVVLLITHDLAGLPPDEQSAALTELMTKSVTSVVVLALLGCVSSVIAGYISARLAKHDALLNGALASTLCTLLVLYTLISGTGAISVIASVLLLPLGPLLGAAGGYLWMWREANRAMR